MKRSSRRRRRCGADCAWLQSQGARLRSRRCFRGGMCLDAGNEWECSCAGGIRRRWILQNEQGKARRGRTGTHRGMCGSKFLEDGMSVYEKLRELKISLPEITPPAAGYIPFVRADNIVYVAGHIAKKDGKAWTGQLGREIT